MGGQTALLSSIATITTFLCASSSIAAPRSVLPDPGLTNPKLHFHTGRVANNAPERSPILPDIPGDASPWLVAQWNKTDLLKPDEMISPDPDHTDPRLGHPLYTFATGSKESRVSIYAPKDGPKVFELAASGGSLSSVGGSNIFLSADVVDQQATFDKQLVYSMNMKLSQATISAPSSAQKSGAVLGQIISGFSLHFTNPATHKVMAIFLQINHGNSRNDYTPFRGCYPHGDNREIDIQNVFPDEIKLPFKASSAAPVHAEFDLNRHLCDALSQPLSCREQDGSVEPYRFPVEANDLHNWRLVSAYFGLETQDRDTRAAAASHGKAGNLSLAVQVSELTLTADAERRSNACPAP